MWVARDRSTTLKLYNNKPIRYKSLYTYEYWDDPKSNEVMEIDLNLFPELKWEDEPVEVVINKLNPSRPAFPWRCCEEHTYNEREREVWLAGWDKCMEYIKKEFGIKT